MGLVDLFRGSIVNLFNSRIDYLIDRVTFKTDLLLFEDNPFIKSDIEDQIFLIRKVIRNLEERLDEFNKPV